MKIGRLDAAAIGVLGGQAMLGGYVLMLGRRSPLPLHFDLAGHVDRWGGRAEVAGWILGFTALDGALYLLLPLLARGRGAARGSGLAYVRAALLAAGVPVALLLGAIGAGVLEDGAPGAVQSLAMGAIALTMTAVGALMGKVGPNPFVGVRTFWALRSRLAWDRSNRLLGRLWFWFGLAGLFAAPLAAQPAGTAAMVAAMVLTSTAAVFESWRVWRSDPDRAPA